MDWTTPPRDQPIWSPPDPAAPSVAAPEPNAQAVPASGPRPLMAGMRRTIATALLAVGLLAVGGVAVVNAADPAASPAPNATTQPPTGSGSGPSTTRPQGPGP